MREPQLVLLGSFRLASGRAPAAAAAPGLFVNLFTSPPTRIAACAGIVTNADFDSAVLRAVAGIEKKRSVLQASAADRLFCCLWCCIILDIAAENMERRSAAWCMGWQAAVLHSSK